MVTQSFVLCGMWTTDRYVPAIKLGVCAAFYYSGVVGDAQCTNDVREMTNTVRERGTVIEAVTNDARENGLYLVSCMQIEY